MYTDTRFLVGRQRKGNSALEESGCAKPRDDARQKFSFINLVLLAGHKREH